MCRAESSGGSAETAASIHFASQHGTVSNLEGLLQACHVTDDAHGSEACASLLIGPISKQQGDDEKMPE